jgi:uncharacterized protein with HEPN domain
MSSGPTRWKFRLRHMQEAVDKILRPWPQIRGIRNRIVHGYDHINLSIIWNVVEVELPPLVPHLEQIMNEAVE